MNHAATIVAIVAYIENNWRGGIEFRAMERAVGLSLSRIRALFLHHTGKSLSRYILTRRVSHAAFLLIHEHKHVIDAAMACGFSNPDTFTRAFRRITGLNPSAFISQRRIVGRIPLYNGIYGVSENPDKKGMNTMNKPMDGSVILYNVPKVGYGVYGCTPFPICLKSVANYLGDDIDYAAIIAQCGAAFRLTWDINGWFGGNVDVCYTFDEYETVYKMGVEALGRKYARLERTAAVTKQAFIDFIKYEIDNGRPCIATGIIGPPEACIITGYRDNGDTLLGWNFFQHSEAFGSKNTTFDDSGYFVCTDWWENECTESVISVGELTDSKISVKEVVSVAIEVLTGRRHEQFAKGIAAYGAWNAAISNDSDFSDNLVFMSERMMCQGDAMDCLIDGRSNASKLFMKLYSQNIGQPLYKEIAASFDSVVCGIHQMAETWGGWERGEEQLRLFAKPEIRKQISRLILVCKEADEKALAKLKELHEML